MHILIKASPDTATNTFVNTDTAGDIVDVATSHFLSLSLSDVFIEYVNLHSQLAVLTGFARHVLKSLHLQYNKR